METLGQPHLVHISIEGHSGQAFGNDRAGGDQALDVDSRLEAHCLQQEDQVLSDDIAACPGRVRASAEAALRMRPEMKVAAWSRSAERCIGGVFSGV